MPYLPTCVRRPGPEKGDLTRARSPRKISGCWFCGASGASRTRGQDRLPARGSQRAARLAATGRYPAEKALRQLLQALVAVVPRLGETAVHLGGQRRVSPEVAGGRLGAGRVSQVSAAEQRPRGGHGIPRVVPGGQRVVPRRLARVLIDEGPRHSG